MDLLTTHRNPNIEQLRTLERDFAVLYGLLENEFQQQIPQGNILLDDIAQTICGFRRRMATTSRALKE